MGHSNGQITAPVNTDDVSAVLGLASHDVKTLCMHDRIHKWAKYKPEAIGGPGTITLNQRKANNFGLSPTTVYTGITAFRNAVANGTFTGGWTYTRVGANDWGRLDDFTNPNGGVGYNDNARIPFGTLLPFTAILGNNSNQNVIIPLDAPEDIPSAGDDNGLLMITDFEKPGAVYKDWYLGILLFYTSSKYLVGFSKNKMSGGDWQVDFGYLNPATYASDNIKGIPFLATSNNTNDATMKIVGIGSAGVTIKLKTITQLVGSIISCSFVSPISLDAMFMVQLTNTDTTQKVLAGVAIMVATSSTGANQTTIKTFGSVTVGANGTWTQTGRITVTNRSYRYCKLISTTTTWGNIDSGWVEFEELEESPEG